MSGVAEMATKTVRADNVPRPCTPVCKALPLSGPGRETLQTESWIRPASVPRRAAVLKRRSRFLRFCYQVLLSLSGQ